MPKQSCLRTSLMNLVKLITNYEINYEMLKWNLST